MNTIFTSIGWIVLAAGLAATAHAQSISLTRTSELRADKTLNAAVVSQLPLNTTVQVMSLEGGWAHVQIADKLGWIRASHLNLQAVSSTAANIPAGREARGNTALTLGVRSLPERSNRHALIIGISRYADANIPPLPGAHVDKESATQMASAMQVPRTNITYLHDEAATGNGIRNAIRALNARVADGDRVFIHYSGHGTRSKDPVNGGCIEALLAYEGNSNAMITNKEMATLLTPITNKTDKLFVMYDACHSGGVIQSANTVRTRGFFNSNDEGKLRPKFAALSDECERPVNMKSRNLLIEAVEQKTLPQDIVHVSSSRDNEVSFDDEQKGGLATQFMRDCMLRDAKDLDNSGSVSIDEIKQCAQDKLNERMNGDPLYKAHNLLLTGNADFVPAWFSQTAIATTTTAGTHPVAMPVALPAPTSDATTPVAKPPATASAQTSTATQTKPPVVAVPPVAVSPPQTSAPVVMVPSPPPVLTGEQALRQMYDQRNGKHKVDVSTNKSTLKIGQDTMDFSVTSSKAGYVYVALAASDNKSLYVMFPNDLDKNNRIEAGQTLTLPRPNWRIRAQGPEGTNQLLVFVSDGPRDLSKLANSKAGPFTASLNNADGRAELGALMTNSQAAATAACTSANARKSNPHCSDAYGAAMLSVRETK